MNDQFERLHTDAVISMDDGDQILISHPTFRADEFIEGLSANFHYEVDEKLERWFKKGAKCQVLTPGKPWRKGKVRVCLEFIPDEVDSPLDDIRQAIADDSQPD